MMKTLRALAAALVLMFPVGAGAQDHVHATSAEKLGSVNFTTSCSAAAQSPFNRAVALLHSFEFLRAIDGFGATLAADPSCAMADWGIALSRWSNPFAVGIRPAGPLQEGRAAVERARAIGAKTERERAYVDAVSRLYDNFETIDQASRVRAYRDAMSKVAAAYPNDREASIVYALSLAAAASPADKTFADQLKAGAILERLIVRQPDHPGLAHYIIHAYDVPPLANRAVEAARRYAKIAPSAPHALHMPSHTFTRLGYWQDSIETNTASGEAAKRDGSVAEELHTMDYRVYAYLQTTQDRNAKMTVDALTEVASRFNPDAIGSAAARLRRCLCACGDPGSLCARARCVGRGCQTRAASEQVPVHGSVHVFRARHQRRAYRRHGDRSGVDRSVAENPRPTRAGRRRLLGRADRDSTPRGICLARLRRAQDRADALAEMRAAATLEDNTEKSAVTPGPLAPARELLGEMLLELKEPAQARKEFEATLNKEPNRFRAVYGAARAASLMGDRAAARRYYAQLLKISERGDKPGRPELAEARQASR